MRKWLVLALLWAVPVLTFAATDSPPPVLNQIMYQTSTEGWVSTQTAEVVVNVSASLTEAQLAQAHADMLSQLNDIVKADWHITQFNRASNDSGLEQLQVEAKARLPEAQLTNVRSQAKKLSKPGETFTIAAINFEPSLAETEAMRQQLRNQVYEQVQRELVQVNKIYPAQHYVVHTINFMEGMMPQPGPRAMVAMAVNAPLAVQDKMMMTANVTLVSVNQ